MEWRGIVPADQLWRAVVTWFLRIRLENKSDSAVERCDGVTDRLGVDRPRTRSVGT